MKKEIIVALEEPISYAPKKGGEKVQSQTLTIGCPSQKQLGSISVIDTIYAKYTNNSQKSIMDMFGISSLPPFEMTKRIEEFKNAFDSAEKEKKDKFKLSDMKAHITGEQLSSCYGALQNILCGNARLDDETCINTISYKELSLIDLENMLQEFIDTFIIRSQVS